MRSYSKIQAKLKIKHGSVDIFGLPLTGPITQGNGLVVQYLESAPGSSSTPKTVAHTMHYCSVY